MGQSLLPSVNSILISCLDMSRLSTRMSRLSILCRPSLGLSIPSRSPTNIISVYHQRQRSRKRSNSRTPLPLTSLRSEACSCLRHFHLCLLYGAICSAGFLTAVCTTIPCVACQASDFIFLFDLGVSQIM